MSVDCVRAPFLQQPLQPLQRPKLAPAPKAPKARGLGSQSRGFAAGFAVGRRCQAQAEGKAGKGGKAEGKEREQTEGEEGKECKECGKEGNDFEEDFKDLDSQILSLALPALIALCAEPVLSIIDTGFVGRLANAPLCLGGLGAASQVFDFVFRCYNFLCVVLVPLVAEAVAKKQKEQKEQKEQEKEDQEDLGNEAGNGVNEMNEEGVARGVEEVAEVAEDAEIVGRVMGLAVCLGLVTWLLLELFSKQALELAGVSPSLPLGQIASRYLKIRAVALPASLVNTVAVGAFRGHLDTTTPLYVILLQAFCDVVLDAVFVFGVEDLNIPALGVEGAAWSTVAAIWISCVSFCFLLSNKGYVEWRAALSWPSALKELQPLVVGSLSQLIRTLSLQAVLLELTKSVVALDASGLAAAAHQVGLRVWFFTLFALDSIAVAAQGLVPVAMAVGMEKARWISMRLLQWGGVGGLCSGIVLALFASYIPSVFTNDQMVREASTPLILVVAFLQPLAGLVFTWDGLFQGLSDYSYLALAMAAASLVTLAVLQIDIFNGSLQGVWVCFSIFLVGRALGLAWRFFGPGPLRKKSL